MRKFFSKATYSPVLTMLDFHDPLYQLLAFGSGVLLHTTLYRHGEWDLFVPSLFGLYGLLSLCVVGWDQLSSPRTKDSLFGAFKGVACLDTSHILGIALSMTVYRLWFHRLKKFPGPFWARISNVYLTLLTAKKLHAYSEVEALHQKYGDIVRVGE